MPSIFSFNWSDSRKTRTISLISSFVRCKKDKEKKHVKSRMFGKEVEPSLLLYRELSRRRLQKFQREARAALKELADAAGYTLHKFLPNHYQFSAILQEHETGAYAYVSISDVRFFRNAWATNILYRQMRDEYDWHGGDNHYCTLTGLSTALQSLYLKEEAKV